MIIREMLEHMPGASFEGDQNRPIGGFSLDSRTVRKGDVFFALDGPTHRAIDFTEEIRKKDAACMVAEKKYATELSVWKGNVDIIFVDSIMTALHETAAWYKSLFNVITVGVTGSNGKTTTKELAEDH
jgi:UDP-N-acetylmuramoyl-tripeptide--D-alanyl-D-alanine ligase